MKTADVFGVRSKLIASYIERESVDSLFVDALTTGNEVVVYGSSKQGKTSLILKHLTSTHHIKVECSPQTQPVDIYKSILRQLDITFIDSEVRETSYEHGAKVNAGFKIKVPLLGETGIGGEAADKAVHGTSHNVSYIEYNLALAQDVSELLKRDGRNSYLVLENFHYLALDVQEALAYDLRVFQDNGIIFIILGIWREANRLVQFNGDLLDRITEIPVEPWIQSDFEKVIQKGQGLLNVDFGEVQHELIKASFDSIGVIQELCKECCLAAGVKETGHELVRITEEHLQIARRKKAEEYGVRHVRNFESFSDVARKTSNQSGKPSLAYPFYFIRILLTADLESIEKGLPRSRLLEQIRSMHHRPDDVRSSDLDFYITSPSSKSIRKFNRRSWTTIAAVK